MKMFRHALALLLLVGLGLGVTWFYVERQETGEQPSQRATETAPGETQPKDEGAKTPPPPASQAGADATIEAPAEGRAESGQGAISSARSGLGASTGEARRTVRDGGQQAASGIAGGEGRTKGEASGPPPAPATSIAPPSGSVVKGKASVAPSKDIEAAAVPDARIEASAEPPAEVAAAASPDRPAVAEGRAEAVAPAPSEEKEVSVAEPAAPASPADEREPAPVDPKATPETPEPDEQALAALPDDQPRPEGDVSEPDVSEPGDVSEPQADTGALSAESIRRALSAITGGSDEPLPEPPEAPATTEPPSAPVTEESAGGRAQEGEEAGPWWDWLRPDGLREALAGLFGGDAEKEGGERPSGDVAVAEGPGQPEATGEPKSAREQTESDEAPTESLSAETIRRALAALVGGDEAPAPAAGPDEPEVERERAEPEPERAEPDSEVAEEPEPEVAEPGPIRPTFDIVRINRDRTAIIAGRAEPDAKVEVVVGDRVIDRVSADRRGQWVSTPLEPLEPGDREMTVVARLEDGGRIDSDQVVVVAVPEPPPPQPPAVASAEAPPPQPPPSAGSEPPPPQPPETAASEAPPPQPPETATSAPAQPVEVASRAPDEAVAVLMPKDGKGAGRILQAPGRIGNDGNLALMVVDYDAEGKTRISGEAPPGAPVRIYVDNRRAADVVTTQRGEWQAVLEDELDPGTYTLRLDQLGESGKPVARLETPFERVAKPPVAGQVAVDYVVVQPGNSLWRIARRLFGDGIKYVHIYEANQTQIRDPDLIYPGQVFEVPKDLQAAG